MGLRRRAQARARLDALGIDRPQQIREQREEHDDKKDRAADHDARVAQQLAAKLRGAAARGWGEGGAQ
jgi:hypothetical protein